MPTRPQAADAADDDVGHEQHRGEHGGESEHRRVAHENADPTTETRSPCASCIGEYRARRSTTGRVGPHAASVVTATTAPITRKASRSRRRIAGARRESRWRACSDRGVPGHEDDCARSRREGGMRVCRSGRADSLPACDPCFVGALRPSARPSSSLVWRGPSAPFRPPPRRRRRRPPGSPATIAGCCCCHFPVSPGRTSPGSDSRTSSGSSPHPPWVTSRTGPPMARPRSSAGTRRSGPGRAPPVARRRPTPRTRSGRAVRSRHGGAGIHPAHRGRGSPGDRVPGPVEPAGGQPVAALRGRGGGLR